MPKSDAAERGQEMTNKKAGWLDGCLVLAAIGFFLALFTGQQFVGEIIKALLPGEGQWVHLLIFGALIVWVARRSVSAWERVLNHLFPDRCKHGTPITKTCQKCEEAKIAEQRRMDRLNGELKRREEERKRQEEEQLRRARELKRQLKEIRRHEVARGRRLAYLKQMDPIEFENVVADAYKNLGWEAEVRAVTVFDGPSITVFDGCFWDLAVGRDTAVAVRGIRGSRQMAASR